MATRVDFMRRMKVKFDSCVRDVLYCEQLSDRTITAVISRAESIERDLNRAKGQLVSDINCQHLLDDVASFLQEMRGQQHGNSAPSSTAYQSPLVATGTVGPPKYDITREQVQYLVGIGMTSTMMAEACQVSQSTMKRRLREFDENLRDQYCTLSDADLDQKVTSAIGHNHKLGYESVRARLLAQGTKVQRARIRDSMSRVDPAGLAMRSVATKIERRVYSVPSPNSLWHIDGNHKLIRWRMVVHGAVDGASRLVTFMRASDNNRQETVFSYFSTAISLYGVPSRIRVDYGGENNDVVLFMKLFRMEDNAAMRGKSVHNQRIERLWRDMWNGATNTFYAMFTAMEREDILDPCNEQHMWALHYVFLPRLNQELDVFRAQWNMHSMSTAKGQTPTQQFVLGCLRNRNSSLRATTELFIDQDAADGTQGWQPNELEGSPQVHLPATTCPLDEEQLAALKREVNPLAESADNGVSLYKTTLTFLDSH